MAYYHDLGKTENPTFFIENQFGIPNPHDFLDPKESAEIIRSHVTAGVALAREYKIPTDVTRASSVTMVTVSCGTSTRRHGPSASRKSS